MLTVVVSHYTTHTYVVSVTLLLPMGRWQFFHVNRSVMERMRVTGQLPPRLEIVFRRVMYVPTMRMGMKRHCKVKMVMNSPLHFSNWSDWREKSSFRHSLLQLVNFIIILRLQRFCVHHWLYRHNYSDINKLPPILGSEICALNAIVDTNMQYVATFKSSIASLFLYRQKYLMEHVCSDPD